MTYSLCFLPPRQWYESLPSKRWDAKNEKYAFRPSAPKDIAEWYENYLYSQLVAHALRLLNLQHELDEETEAWLARDLEAHAIAAARAVGLTFGVGRNTTYARMMAGTLALGWLTRSALKAATFAFSVWDPDKAMKRHEAAVRGGRNSRRGKTYTSLPVGSIRAQMEALNCSRSTVLRLRREMA